MIISTTDHLGNPVLFNSLDSLVGIEDGMVYVRTQGISVVLMRDEPDDVMRDYIKNLY